MISVTPNPATSNSSAPGVPAMAAPAVPSPFDAILTLESLAATCAALDSSPLGGGALEGGSLEGLEDSTDESETDGEEPLDFLAGLMSVVPAAPPSQTASNDGAVEAAIDDSLAGQARHAAVPDEQISTPATSATSATTASTATPAAPMVDATSIDAAMAGKLLAVADPASANEAVDAASTDVTTAQEATAGIARAAEWLSHGPRHVTAAARDVIPTPVHSPRWVEDLGARVSLMVRGGESSASLQLSPVDLGPVEVNVTVRDSQASIHFGAAQAETRALLEASIPRLREMLAAQGFNLMDASVSQGFARQSRPDVPAAMRPGTDAEGEVVEVARITANGLLDLYA
jgi:flagellar hook-length control protein FliK